MLSATPELLLVGAVAAVGVLHTVVPDHWLPIAVLARRQGWSRGEVARAASVAGIGHTVSTLLIGVVVWTAGVAFAAKFGNLVSIASSLALVGFGAWIALSSLRDLRGGRHPHSHALPHEHSGSEGTSIDTHHGTIELSVYEQDAPPRFRLSGYRGDRVWLDTTREGGLQQRFGFVDRGDFWESIDEVPEPHAFAIKLWVADGADAHSYDLNFAEHAHDDSPAEGGDALYVPSPAGTAVLARHVHAHRHGRAGAHVHLHDHDPDTWHGELTAQAEPPVHEHRHKRPARTTLLLILGSSPMIEGIPAFFAAGRYGWALIAVMAAVFAIATIGTYVLLCVTSAAGLERVHLGPFERYGEVLSGAFIAAVGLVFLIFPVL